MACGVVLEFPCVVVGWLDSDCEPTETKDDTVYYLVRDATGAEHAVECRSFEAAVKKVGTVQ